MYTNNIFHKIKGFGIKEWISLAALTIPAVFLAYIWAISPAIADDLMYISTPIHYMAEGRGLWAGILEVLRDHAMYDNIRLANISYLLSAFCVPRPLMACIMAVCFSAGIWVFTRVVSGGLHTPLIVCAILFTYTYILQWLILLSHDYLLNYLPTMLFVGIVLYMFLRIDTLSRGKRKLLYILAFVLGMWHECGALPLLLAFTVYMLATRRATKAQILVCVLLFLGVALASVRPDHGRGSSGHIIMPICPNSR